MTPAEMRVCDALRKDFVIAFPCSSIHCSFEEGFSVGLSHAREQAAARLAERSDGLTGEHAGFAAAELREQAAKIRSGK